MKKVGMISLGCAKNLVDAEIMLDSVRAQGMEITSNAEEADVLIVNTCAFIDSAKEESIEAILQSHEARGLRRRPGQKLIVSGCMAQRFSTDLAKEMPEVDAFMGLDQVAQAGEIIQNVFNRSEGLVTVSSAAGVLTDETLDPLNLVTRGSRYIPDWDTPRFRLTPSHSAYVKIAEGCNHPCSFCVIPQMRGRHRSRTIESVVREVRGLVAEGVKEINLISQDTTYYGMDLWEQKAGPRQPVDSTRGVTLSRLLDELGAIEGEFWVRLLYTHPAHWSDELIAAIGRNDKVARYVDMPLQHIHPDMLALMRRETSREHIEESDRAVARGHPGPDAADHVHHGLSRGDGRAFREPAGVHRAGKIRAAGHLQLLPGRGEPRGEDGRTDPDGDQTPPPCPGDEAPTAYSGAAFASGKLAGRCAC